LLTPIILAGGSGTRLWPLSRRLYPKQYIGLLSDRSLFQETLVRLSTPDFVSRPIVVCNEEHRFLVAEQLRQNGIQPEAIILEPMGKNTAPAVCAAAELAISRGMDSDLLLLPADHHFQKPEELLQILKQSLHHTKSGNILTFGIVPRHPETGYGYIQRGEPVASNPEGSEAFRIQKFVEKPDRPTAKQYLEDGAYYWNSGMFLCRARCYLRELKEHSPKIATRAQKALHNAEADMDFIRLDSEHFARCPEDSIDYAIMEKTQNGMVVPLDAGWNDVGSWDGLWSIQEKDAADNVVLGDVISRDVHNSYLHASSRLVAAVGVSDQVIVETADAVMVCPKSRVQDVKLLVEALKKEERSEAEVHARVYRPWGSYETMVHAGRFQVKRITVYPGAKLSLQKHYHRSEHWVVVEGTALITNGSEQFVLNEDHSTYIPLGHVHRLENPGKIPLEIIEVQTGSYLGEDDIVRTEDVYGRN